jgi:hypothetical protein
MAKNKNRKQPGRQTRSSQDEQQSKSTTTEARSAISAPAPGTPADVARKQRRFGHN